MIANPEFSLIIVYPDDTSGYLGIRGEAEIVDPPDAQRRDARTVSSPSG